MGVKKVIIQSHDINFATSVGACQKAEVAKFILRDCSVCPRPLHIFYTYLRQTGQVLKFTSGLRQFKSVGRDVELDNNLMGTTGFLHAGAFVG